MRHALNACANLVLALDNQDAIWLQDALGFYGSLDVELENSVMPFVAQFGGAIAVRIVFPKGRMRPVSSKGVVTSIQPLHVRGIENNTINLAIAIWELAAINTHLDVCGQESILSRWDALPEDTLAKGNISHLGPGRHVQSQDMRENLTVVPGISREHQLGRCPPVGRLAFRFHADTIPNPNAYASYFLRGRPGFFFPFFTYPCNAPSPIR